MRLPATLLLCLCASIARCDTFTLTTGYNNVTNHALFAAHIHSEASEPPDPAGNKPLENIAKFFGDTNNFAAYCITEHDQFSTNAVPSYANGLFITGQEWTKTHHIVMMWTTGLVAGGYPPIEGDTPTTQQTAINAARSHGGLVGFAHPNSATYPWTAAEMLALTNWNFVEVYNTLSDDVYGLTQGSAEDKWDAVLTAGRRCYGFAALDMHTTWITNGFNYVFLTETNSDSMKSAMSNGNFTFGRNHKLLVAVTNNTIYANTLGVTSRFEWIRSGPETNQATASATSDSYTMDGSEGYIRIRAFKTGESGSFALSQPFFVDVTRTTTVAGQIYVR